MIIVISDPHLAAFAYGDKTKDSAGEKSEGEKTREDDAQFVEFLKHLSGDQLSIGGHLLILGDAVDYWRRGLAGALLDSMGAIDLLRRLKLDRNVSLHYVVGNHDYYNWDLRGLIKNYYPFDDMGKQIRLSDGGRDFFFIHGHQIEMMVNPYYNSLDVYESFSEQLCLSGQYLGVHLSGVWDLYKHASGLFSKIFKKDLPDDVSRTLESMSKGPEERLHGEHKAADSIKKLAIEREALEKRFGLKKEEYLVFGHTHIPFHSQEALVINAGSWNKEPCKSYAFLQIDGGVPRLRKFENGTCADL